MRYEFQIPVFPHDPDGGIYSSSWTNDCWGQGNDDSDFHSVQDAEEAVRFFMTQGPNDEDLYVRIVNIAPGEVEKTIYFPKNWE